MAGRLGEEWLTVEGGNEPETIESFGADDGAEGLGAIERSGAEAVEEQEPAPSQQQRGRLQQRSAAAKNGGKSDRSQCGAQDRQPPCMRERERSHCGSRPESESRPSAHH